MTLPSRKPSSALSNIRWRDSHRETNFNLKTCRPVLHLILAAVLHSPQLQFLASVLSVRLPISIGMHPDFRQWSRLGQPHAR